MSGVKSQGHDALLLNLAKALADHPRASMEQLATMVGISRATLCRYFASRESMMLAMSDAGITSAQQALARARPHEGPVEQAIRRLIKELLPIAELYAHVNHAMHLDRSLEARAQPIKNALAASFKEWQGAGHLRVDLPAAWLVESMSALLRSAATMVRNGRLARQDAVQNVFDLLWSGMSK